MTRSIYDRWTARLKIKSPATYEKYTHFVQRLIANAKKSARDISDYDVQMFLNSLPGYPSRMTAYHAIKSFFKEMGRVPKDIDLGHSTEPRTIVELSDEEYQAMVVACNTLYQRVLLALLRDTGGRATAISQIKVLDIHEDHVILRSDTAKNKRMSVAPLAPDTSKLLQEYIASTKPKDRVFPNLNRRRLWDYLQRIAKRSGITKQVYPHLFRHMRALNFRRKKAQDDTVLNALGWADTRYYNERYGRRTALETLTEAKGTLTASRSDLGDNSPIKAIEQLAMLLADGKIDLQTYQASIVALTEKRPSSKKGPDVAGYQ